MKNNAIRTRWSAIGAAVAITLGAGGIGLVSATSPADAVAYVPIEPCRIADTRPAFNVGPRSTPIGADETHVIAAHGDNGDCTGIPATATGLQLNVTAVGASQDTFVTIWGEGSRPTASSLNPSLGQPPTPNAVTTGLTATGRFNVFNRFGNVDIIADVVGYYTDHDHDDRYYTETEVDASLATKANSDDVYTKSESNQRYDNTEAAIDSSSSSVALSATDVIVATVTIDTPTSGYVVLNSGGYLFNSAADTTVRCSMGTGTAVDFNASFNSTVGDSSTARMPAGSTRGWQINYGFVLFPPTAETTFNLVCDTSGGSATYADPQFTAIFVPDPDAFSGFIVLPLDEPAAAPTAADG